MTNEQGLLLNLSTALGCLTSARNNIEAMQSDGGGFDFTFIFLQIVSLEEGVNDLAETARKHLLGDTQDGFDGDLDIFFTNEN